MCWLRKKKIFKITWRYCCYPTIAPSTEYIRASDLASAWAKIRKQESPNTITMLDWEEIT